MELFDHQKRIIDEDKEWTGIFQGTGSAKTRTCLELARGTTLVICPKQQKLDRTFEVNQQKFGIVLYVKVMSKEEFRRDWQTLPPFDTVIVDEAHHMLGVTPDTKQVNKVTTPKTSQLFDALIGYVQKNKPKRFYLATATPASKPMNVWAIGRLFGKQWDFFAFRNKYYIERKMGFRSVWLPRNSIELKSKLVELIKELGYTGQLSDWFDVPEQTHKYVFVGLSDDQKKAIKAVYDTNSDPMSARAKVRTIENGCEYGTKVVTGDNAVDKMEKIVHYYTNEKIDQILQLAVEFPKMLIFANYTGQIMQIAHNLAHNGYKVLTLTGATKNREEVMRLAESMDNVIVIAQSQICEGYEFKSCPCVVFASKSRRYLHFNQACGRVLRADAIKKNLYIHLIVKDSLDHECHRAIEAGEDFQEKIMSNDE